MKCHRCKVILIYVGRGRPPKYCKKCAYAVHRYQKMIKMREIRKINPRYGRLSYKELRQTILRNNHKRRFLVLGTH